MTPLIRYVALLLLESVVLVQAQAPRWGFLGDDGALVNTYDDAKNVVFVCVFETELRDVRPPFAEVVYRATVIENYKGTLKVGEKIEISFRTDSLPSDKDECRKFVENADKGIKGTLRFAFLDGGKDGDYFCEFMDVPRYSGEMQEFIRKLQSRPKRPQGEQVGADQPATAPELKSEGDKNLKPESEGRSQ